MEKARMKAAQCKGCGTIYYPKRNCCPSCRGKEFEDTELANECELTTYTRLFAVPNGIDQIPLVLGIVRFENGVKALGQIMSEDAKIGMKLKPIWGPLRKLRGREVYGFKFKPID